MKKLLLISSIISVISVFFFIPACSNKDKLPKGILSKQQMKDVLWDLVKGGEYLESYLLVNDTSHDKASKEYDWYEHIFSLHKTTREVFVKSYNWYQQHPAMMKPILDSLSNIPTFIKASTQDSAAVKDSTLKKSTLKDSTIRKDSSLKDTLFKQPIVLPGQKRPVFNIDSIRKIQLRKRMK